MSRTLPPRPSLEQLKKQAKDLRREHQSASPPAAERIEAHLPRCSGATTEDILRGDFPCRKPNTSSPANTAASTGRCSAAWSPPT